VCFNFRDTGTCHFGDRCAFPHAAPSGHAIRLTGDQKVLTSPGPRYAAPGTARAYPYPPVIPLAACDRPAQMTEENGAKKPNRLMLMSQGKIGGIYGDWPEQKEQEK
uniref:C3H1-type domain-containing protein n=2 Tax=Aegilops tauschii subsp. strangulata TaxID=200361 RepID=A0A453EB36_AEGTS